jgi:hypothetical protein
MSLTKKKTERGSCHFGIIHDFCREDCTMIAFADQMDWFLLWNICDYYSLFFSFCLGINLIFHTEFLDPYITSLSLFFCRFLNTYILLFVYKYVYEKKYIYINNINYFKIMLVIGTIYSYRKKKKKEVHKILILYSYIIDEFCIIKEYQIQAKIPKGNN